MILLIADKRWNGRDANGGRTTEHDGKDGVFRAIVADGAVVGNISIEQKTDVYKDGEVYDLYLYGMLK